MVTVRPESGAREEISPGRWASRRWCSCLSVAGIANTMRKDVEANRDEYPISLSRDARTRPLRQSVSDWRLEHECDQERAPAKMPATVVSSARPCVSFAYF